MDTTLEPNSTSPDMGAETPQDQAAAPSTAAGLSASAPANPAPAAGTGTPAAAPQPSAPAQPAETQPSSSASAGGNPIHRMLDGILTALGGSTVTHYQRNPDGSMDVTKAPASTGDKWRSIVAGALAGLAGGAGAAPGPGQMGRALAGGVAGGMKMTQARDEKAYDRANTDFEAQQTAKLRQAQTALMTQQLAESAFNLGRQKVTAKFSDADRENGLMSAILAGGAGSKDLGVVEMPEGGDYFHGLQELVKQNPGLLKEQAKGNVVGIPHVNAQGQIDGMHFALVTPEWKNAKLAQDSPFFVVTPAAKAGDPPTITKKTVPAGTMTNGDYMNAVQAQEGKILEWYKANTEATAANTAAAVAPSTIGKNRAEATEAIAGAHEKEAEGHYYDQSASQLGGDPNNPALQHDAMMLVEGYLDPEQLSKRSGGKGSSLYQSQLRAADTYSMQHYGQHFNAAQATIDYRYAQQKGTQDTLRYLNSLVGPDGKGGNLAELVRVSNSIPRSQFPPVNDLTQWGKLMAGNPQLAAYYGVITEVSDQVAKILQGGGAGGTSDKKMEQANNLFQKGFTAQQIAAVAGELLPLLGNRKANLIGNNRYLLRQFGPQTPANSPQNPGGSGANGNGQTPLAFSKSAWLKANPKGDINAAVAAAQAAGHPVID